MINSRPMRIATVAGALMLGALGPAAVAAADTVPPSMLNTTCSLDQILAATKVVDPVAYGELIGKYNSEPAWIQGGIVYHMNLLLQKSPQERQAEVNQLVGIFPEYVSIFTAAEPVADKIAALCPTLPAEDPAAWNPAAPPAAPVAAPIPAAPAAPAPAPAAPAPGA